MSAIHTQLYKMNPGDLMRPDTERAMELGIEMDEPLHLSKSYVSVETPLDCNTNCLMKACHIIYICLERLF